MEKDSDKKPLSQFQKLLAALLSVPKKELDEALIAEEAEKREPEEVVQEECEPE